MIGFCRSGLFKRLESSGHSFLLSIRRHVMRNKVYQYALANNYDLPIGSVDAVYFDDYEDGIDNPDLTPEQIYALLPRDDFDWLPSDLFDDRLAKHLDADIDALQSVLEKVGEWRPKEDEKLAALRTLVQTTHSKDKVLVFSQFADTIDYLTKELNIAKLANVTGNTKNIASIVGRFAPDSSSPGGTDTSHDEIRVLLTTDTLSEGQNLQDAHVIVNYDLPWAIIRLIQRAGRVDRIGQKSPQVFCYSFLPAEGVEHVLNLRKRLRQRLDENAEVVGTDEAFFEDENSDRVIRDLYAGTSGVLDDPADDEVDLSSLAWQIWKNATDANPSLKKTIPELPNVVFSTKPARSGTGKSDTGVSPMKNTTGETPVSQKSTIPSDMGVPPMINTTGETPVPQTPMPQSPLAAIWCLARGPYKRIPQSPIDCRSAVASGRLTIVSPFPEKVTRITRETAYICNRPTTAQTPPTAKQHSYPFHLPSPFLAALTFGTPNATVHAYTFVHLLS